MKGQRLFPPPPIPYARSKGDPTGRPYVSGVGGEFEGRAGSRNTGRRPVPLKINGPKRSLGGKVAFPSRSLGTRDKIGVPKYNLGTRAKSRSLGTRDKN